MQQIKQINIQKRFCCYVKIICRIHKSSLPFLQFWAESCVRYSFVVNVGDYDVDVNGLGAFSPP